MKTIIILGGGIGGIMTANELSNRMSGKHKIILIEKNKDHSFAPSYLWLMNGSRTKKQVSVPLKSLLPGRWKPDKPMMLPKAGVFPHLQAEVVAKNIVHAMNGEKETETFQANGYCMLEAGEHRAGFAYGDFFGQPHPQVHFQKIGKRWHTGKSLFEKWWLSPLGFKKTVYKHVLQTGGKLLGIPVQL